MIALCSLFILMQDPDEKLRAMQEQLDAMKRQLQDMEAIKQKLAQMELEMAVLRAEAAPMPSAREEKPTPLNFLNPTITVFGNLGVRIDSKTVRNEEGDQVDDHFFLRAVEVDFRAAVDPYADAVVILAVEQEGDGEFAVEAEEAYAVLKRLPILEDAPLGMRVKAGRFRPPFGVVNQLHLHDLPWVTRPEAVVEYLGSESGNSFFEGGWADEGGGLSFLLPDALTPEDMAVELSYYAMDTGSIAIADGNGGTIPGHMARAQWNIKADDENDFILGSSYYRETGHRGIDLFGGDFMFRHKPDDFQSVVVGGELFYGDRKFYVDDTRARNTPLGGFVYVQYQPDWPWYLGARFDRIDDVDDDELQTSVAGAHVSYYTSEFLRFRVGYEHRWSDIDLEDGNNSVFVELNWIFGSHPTEPFWVNR